MRTLKILGCLIAYPTKEQIQALPEFSNILRDEKWLPEETLESIDHLIKWMSEQSLLDLQEEYVALFDRTPSLCLHLFEHIHGDSRDRGQALVDLSQIYEEAGLIINTKEMPDYLPLFLEYLSVIDNEESRKNIGETANVIGVLAGRLRNRQSPYASIFDALIEAASSKPDKNAVEKALKESTGSAKTFKEIDETWEEQMAFENTIQTTGQDINSGCPKAEEMLARMNLPLDNKEA